MDNKTREEYKVEYSKLDKKNDLLAAMANNLEDLLDLLLKYENEEYDCALDYETINSILKDVYEEEGTVEDRLDEIDSIISELDNKE